MKNHILKVLFVLGLTHNVQAQTISPEGDQALWCVAAYAYLKENNKFSSAVADEEAMQALQKYFPALRAEMSKHGWDEKALTAFGDTHFAPQIKEQLPDYLKWRDPAALSYPIVSCFPGF